MITRFKGKSVEIAEFLEGFNKKSFEFALRALQQEFDWSGKGGEGSRVDMSGGNPAGVAEANGPLFDHPPLATCVHCDREVPRNEDGKHMLGGELVDCPRPNPEATTHSSTATEGEKQEARGPVLPAIHETMSGRRGRKLTRREESELRTREQVNEHPEMRGDIAAEHHPADGEPVFPVN
jgi:hypothetical protein